MLSSSSTIDTIYEVCQPEKGVTLMYFGYTRHMFGG